MRFDRSNRSPSELAQDLLEDLIWSVGGSHYSKIAALGTRSPLCTVSPVVVLNHIGVLAAVCFHDQARLIATEVSEVWTDRKLAAEFEPFEMTGPNSVQQQFLRIAHFAAEVPRAA